jgi:outer membrane protein assembly factor BamB
MDTPHTAAHRPQPSRLPVLLPLAVAVIAAAGITYVAVDRTTGGQPHHAGAQQHHGTTLPHGTTHDQTASPGTTSSTAWTVYHHDAAGSGDDTSGTNLNPAKPAWTSTKLDGQLYGEPLEATGRVFVATEADTVYALAADSGSVLWSTTIGTPVPAGDLPCGNIAPTVGITSTPVIDTGRGEIFVVGDELVGGAPQHQLVGLDIYTGAVLLRQVVDPPGAYTPAILQRASLTLDQGRVVFGYGGNDGDCSSYHGWVASVPETGGTMDTFEVDDTAPGQSQGAVWMGGAAPVVDSSGNVWAATGNGSVTTPHATFDDGNSVLELSPTMQLKQYWAPATWAPYNGSDQDLGSDPPALIPNGTVFISGKTHHAYLLSQSALGGIGGQLTTLSTFCGGDDDGGTAISGDTVYTPCGTGLVAVETGTSPAGLRVLWRTSTGSAGPAIVASGLVWTIARTGTLYGLDPTDGSPAETFKGTRPATDFATPSVGAGLLLAPGTDTVFAYQGPAGLPGAPAPQPAAPADASYWTAAADGGIFTFGNATFYGSTGNLHLVRPIVGMAPTADGEGYWLVASDGGIFAFGDAPFFGSMGGKPLDAPIVGMARTPDGLGYWLDAADGGIFAFGDARFYGSMGGKPLDQPIVGMAATPGGGGYWEVAADGGIFAFGDAVFDGSMGGKPLDAPIVAMTATSDGGGYWFVASDGGIFAFGDAAFDGSMGGKPLNEPIVDMAATPDGRGYWLVASDGGIFSFGDAGFSGSEGGTALNAPMVAMAVPPGS